MDWFLYNRDLRHERVNPNNAMVKGNKKLVLIQKTLLKQLKSKEALRTEYKSVETVFRKCP